MKTDFNKYYCDNCRKITYHIAIGMNIVCINQKYCKDYKWCQVCGKLKSEHPLVDFPHKFKLSEIK